MCYCCPHDDTSQGGPVHCQVILSESWEVSSQSLPASVQRSCSFWELQGDWQLPPDGARGVLATSVALRVAGAWCCLDSFWGIPVQLQPFRDLPPAGELGFGTWRKLG